MITRSRIETLLWYARRRQLWTTLAPLLRRILFSHSKEGSCDKASEICSTEAISTEEAIERLTRSRADSARRLFPEVLAASARRCEEVPVKMGGGGDIDLLYGLAEYVQARRVLETGVTYGWSSLAILLSISNRDDALLVSTDMPYAKSGNEAYIGTAVPDELRDCWHLIRKPDRSAIQEAIGELGTVDLCHYGNDKSYQGPMTG